MMIFKDSKNSAVYDMLHAIKDWEKENGKPALKEVRNFIRNHTGQHILSFNAILFTLEREEIKALTDDIVNFLDNWDGEFTISNIEKYWKKDELISMLPTEVKGTDLPK